MKLKMNHNNSSSPVDQAYEFIFGAIISGELAPGERVPTEGVAESLGISRMPVRDALRRLEGDGAVTIFANRGASVSAFSPEEITQLTEMRAVLEALAARRALENIGTPEIDELEIFLLRMTKSEKDLNTWLVRHDEFHNYLTELSNRPLLIRQVERMRIMLRPYFRKYILASNEWEIKGLEHDLIFDTILQKDADKLESIIRTHALENIDRIAGVT